MELTISIFQRRRTRHYQWYTVGLGDLDAAWQGANLAKVEANLTEALRKSLANAYPEVVEPIEVVLGRRMLVVRLSISLPHGGQLRRVSGKFPLVLEPRPRGPATDKTPLLRVYHPLRPREWFTPPDGMSLEDAAAAFFRLRWTHLDADEIEDLKAHDRDRLRLVAMSVKTKALRNKLDKKKQKPTNLLGAAPRTVGNALLRELAIDETRRAIDGRLDPGMPRKTLRERLGQLVCGRRRVSVLLVGPSGSGKSTVVRQLVHDLLESDGYPSHRNYDKVQPVFRLAGRRIIAGMSYLGQWEQRCVDLVDAARNARAVLWVEDISAWGRLGETRESERSLATFFRGPVARSEIAIVAECTAEQYQQLVDDAPTFATSFTTLFVEPTDEAETMRMLVHEARRLERIHRVAFEPRALATIYELSRSLGSGSSFPGRALDLLRSMATGDDAHGLDLREAEREAKAGRKIAAIKAYRQVTGARLKAAKDAVESYMERGQWPLRTTGGEPPPLVVRSVVADDFGRHPGPAEISTHTVINRLARRTGMPEVLLDPRRKLVAQRVVDQLGGQIMGQPAAVDAVAELILRIKAGMTDPSRPWGVLLFTGPTGTGKTEMAKCLAEYLYGGGSRLLRFDMSEYADPYAPSRLIGDRARPSGVLTSAVRVQPFCVLLLDEIEKADPSVLNLMLQLFDDGRLTDAAGNLVDFTHTVVVMTSNLGAKAAPSVGFGGEAVATEHEVDVAVREFFPPELFNRIDRVVPFSALSAEAATSIARRELDKLVARRGLTERNVFVRFTDAVVDGVVAEAFDPRYGARSVKRWLEDHVGSWLADEIAGQPVAGVRVLWLHRRDGALRLHAELLVEAEMAAEPGPFGDMLEWHADELRGQIPAAVERLDALRSSPALERLRSRIGSQLSAAQGGDAGAADEVANLEDMRGELLELRNTLETQAEYDPRLLERADLDRRADHEGEAIERLRFGFIAKSVPWAGEVYIRVLHPHLVGPTLPLTRRPDFVEALAAFHFLDLALERAEDPAEHEILIELSRITRPAHAARFAEAEHGLFDWLRNVYCVGRGQLVSEEASDPGPSPDRVVLHVVGPAVRSFYEGEQGSHVRASLAGGSEVVRVRVLPADVTPAAHLQRLATQRQAFVQALEAGAELPDNPDAMLPIVRRYHFDPPSHGTAPIVVEDFPLAYALESRAARLSDVMTELWLLRIGQRLTERS